MKKASTGRAATSPSLASKGATARRSPGKTLSPRLTGSSTGRGTAQTAGKGHAPVARWKGSSTK